jgi:hypothetical protein
MRSGPDDPDRIDLAQVASKNGFFAAGQREMLDGIGGLTPWQCVNNLLGNDT